MWENLSAPENKTKQNTTRHNETHSIPPNNREESQGTGFSTEMPAHSSAQSRKQFENIQNKQRNK
jgi:hypothetical protein